MAQVFHVGCKNVQKFLMQDASYASSGSTSSTPLKDECKINDAESTVLRSLLSGEKEGMDRKRDSTQRQSKVLNHDECPKSRMGTTSTGHGHLQPPSTGR